MSLNSRRNVNKSEGPKQVRYGRTYNKEVRCRREGVGSGWW